MAERTKGTQDKPFRPSDGETPDDIRQAEIQLNERLLAALRRIEHLEQLAKDEGFWVDP
jgi:hypothetical protein